MIYLFESYGEWFSLLSGPDDTDEVALFRSWMESRPLNLDEAPYEMFPMWLATQPGWGTVDVRVWDDRNPLGHSGWAQLVAPWGENPLPQEWCPAKPTHPYTNQEQHFLQRYRNAEGTRVWRCHKCQAEFPVTASKE